MASGKYKLNMEKRKLVKEMVLSRLFEIFLIFTISQIFTWFMTYTLIIQWQVQDLLFSYLPNLSN